MDKKKEGEAHIEAQEALVAEAMQFNLLSNVFMSVALDDIPACQHVLRVLLGKKDLKVTKIRSQYRISKLTSHDAILDILAEDSEGKLCNIEIQRADTLDHARRSRFYGAMIDSKYLEKGKMYDEPVSYTHLLRLQSVLKDFYNQGTPSMQHYHLQLFLTFA